MIDVIMNLKQVKFSTKVFRTSSLQTISKRKKEITAKDIETSGDYEVVNKDLHIATLTNVSSLMEMEFIVESGVGYKIINQRKERDWSDSFEL